MKRSFILLVSVIIVFATSTFAQEPEIIASSTNVCVGNSILLSVSLNGIKDTSNLKSQVNNLIKKGWINLIKFDQHYYLEYPYQATWNQAKLICESFGGNMFCVTSKQENDSVAVPLTTKYPYSDIWIGLYQDITDPLYSEPNGGWKWVDKSTLNYTNWNDGEPNNSGNENYAVLDYNNIGDKWNDVVENISGKVIMEFEGIPKVVWSTGDSTISISPIIVRDTTFWVDIISQDKTYRKSILIKVNPNIVFPPKGLSVQTTCPGSKIKDLFVYGDLIKWYSSEFGGTELASSTPLVDGDTYYASQTYEGCESSGRFAVKVKFDDKNYCYSAFNGDVYNMRAVEKKNIVLLIPSDYIVKSETALDTAAQRIDRMYEYYKISMGFEPAGGLPAFSNKASVAYVNETCGAACGRMGSKGIEIGFPYLDEMLDNVLQNKRGNSLGLASYEFGRNFYTSLIGSKLSFKTNSSSIVNGFAAFQGVKAERYAKANIVESFVIGGNYYYNSLYHSALAYLVNPKMDAKEFFFIEDYYSPELNFNRAYGPIYSGTSFFLFLDSVLVSKDLFPKFWNVLKEQPDVKTDQDALDNIAVSVSLATGINLVNFFNEVLKFNLSSTAIAKISNLPPPNDFTVIKDIKNYEVVNLEDDLVFLSATLSHKSPNLLYKVKFKVNGVVVCEDTTTNSVFKIPVKKCFNVCESSEDRIATIYSVLGNEVKDSCQIVFHYRDTLSANKDILKIAEDSYFTSTYGTGYSQIDYANKSINIFSTGTKEDLMGMGFPFQAIRDREYTIRALMKTSSKGFGNIRYGGGPGYIETAVISSPDTINYFPIEITFNTNMFDTTLFTSFPGQKVVSLNLYNSANVGSQWVSFKNLEVIDVTASSVEWNKKPLRPVITFSEGYLKSNYLTGNQWYFNDEVITGAVNQSFSPSKTGKYQVMVTKDPCMSDLSDPHNFTITSLASLEELNEIVIYPNPAHETINIQTNESSGDISIFDILGRKVIHLEKADFNSAINITYLVKGPYFINIITDTNLFTTKFIKE